MAAGPSGGFRMFAPLPSPAEMSGWDRAAIDLGLPELLLMENASREALHVLSAETGHMPGKRVLLFMGGGNNGGDAACLARHLQDGGAEVLVLHTRPLGGLPGRDGAACAAGPALRRGVCPGCGLARKNTAIRRGMCMPTLPSASGRPGHRRGRDTRHGLFRQPQAAGAWAGGPDQRAGATGLHFSLDIPSGLSGLTGRPCPVAVRAHATVTFEAAKPGLVLPEAAPYTGRLHIRPIGIPAMVRRGASRFLSDDHESHCRSFSGSRSGVAQRGPPGPF